MSVLDTLKAATPSRKSVTLCLDGALQAEWDALLERSQDSAVEAARAASSLADDPLGDVAAALDAVRDRMKASEVTFVFQQMPWTARVALQAEHPARDGNIADRMNGFNIETYYPALVKATCTEVKGADDSSEADVPDDVWDSLFATLSMGQFNALVRAAKEVNDGETTVPPSARSLLGNQDFGASLAQPSPGTSAPDGSEDGNPPGSPKSSATKTAPSKARSAAT